MTARFGKTAVLVTIAILLVAGCATRSNVESRKKERYGAYSQLAPEFRTLVDQGNIKIGMPMDAVYIAWGKPSQIIGGESVQGKVVTWLYSDSYLQGYTYWGNRHSYGRRGYYNSPTLEHDYYPQNYVAAEVNFANGVVRDWRTLPRPE